MYLSIYIHFKAQTQLFCIILSRDMVVFFSWSWLIVAPCRRHRRVCGFVQIALDEKGLEE